MRRRIGPVLLLLLAFSIAYGWVRWSGMPDFAWGSDLFGHLNHSKQIRAAAREGRAPNFVFDSPQARELIGFMKSTGRPVDDWLFLVGPHAHQYMEHADQVANQYSPATGLLLSLFPERKSVSWLIRVSLLALFAFGANAIVLRAIAPSSPQKAPGALVAAMWPALAVFQAIQVLAGSELGNPSIYAVVLPTFAAAFFCALAWSLGNRGRDSQREGWLRQPHRWAAFASGAAAGFAAFASPPGALMIPGFLVLLKRRDWVWFLAGGYFFGFLPLAFYQAHAAGAWWATYGPISTVAPNAGGSGYFLVPLLAFLSYFALRGWRHWRRLGLAALLSFAHPAAAVGLLGWGIFFEYEEPMPEFRIAQAENWRKIAPRFAPLAIMILVTMPWAWAFVSGSRIALQPPLDESVFKKETIPDELLREDVWIWSDTANGAFWYYGDKPAFNIAFGGSPELRRKVFSWVASKGGEQFLILDGGGSRIVERELRDSGALLHLRGEVFGYRYFRVEL